MKLLKHRPEKGLAAEVDGQWWQLESHADYAKAVLLMRERVDFYKDGKPHRADGPATIWAYGYKAWFQNGEFIKHEIP